MYRYKYLLSFFLLGLYGCVFAQESKIEVTKTIFIKNVFVVSKPGATPVLQSILIRNGLIQQLGTIKAPFDAKVVDADSMYGYAGFIDAASYTGIKKEEERKDEPKPASRGVATYKQSGITPQINALSKYNIKESSIADMRKAGFGISQVFPRGKMISGSGSIMSHKEVDHEDKALISKSNSILSSFTTASGAVPSTIIGVIAKYRDLFQNTSIYNKNSQSYASNPSGMVKPTYADELNAMVPIVNKEAPLYFAAQNNKDIHRVLALQKDYGFKLVLTDVKQCIHVLPQLKSSMTPILFSLDLPEEIKDEVKKEEKTEAKKEEKMPMTEEEKMLNDRKNKAYHDYLAQVSEAHKQGLTFSFSYLDAKSNDIHKSIKRLIKAGLPDAAALAALTTTPAFMLGISKTHGTIEVGKVANLVLTDKPLFEDKAEIKYVYIDGQVFDYNEKKKPEAKIDDKGAKIEGTWSYTVEIPNTPQTGTITFEKDGNGYKGSSISSDSPTDKDEIKDIAIDGDKVTFNMDVVLDQPVNVTFDLTFTKDTYSGTVNVGALGTFTIKGNKINGPKN